MSLKTIHIESFLANAETFQVVDVRSEGEFEKGHIQNSVNIPLLDNFERAKIGTTYKKEGREKAVSLGLELVGPKMKELLSKYLSLNKESNKPIVFYCWRGGLRSHISAQIYQWTGKQTNLIHGGYKSYRHWIQSQFEKSFKFKIIGGKTGVGKTEILHLLEQKGHQVVDLEGMANHKGSAFGGLGKSKQPTTEMFENTLGLKLSSFSIDDFVFLENESRLIGNCFLPQNLWDSMNNSEIIEIDCPYEIRQNRLLNEYAHFDIDLLIEKTKLISKKLGGQHANEAVRMLEQREFKGWIDKVLVYYDKTYSFGLSKNSDRRLKLDWDWEDSTNSIDRLINKVYGTK